MPILIINTAAKMTNCSLTPLATCFPHYSSDPPSTFLETDGSRKSTMSSSAFPSFSHAAPIFFFSFFFPREAEGSSSSSSESVSRNMSLMLEDKQVTVSNTLHLSFTTTSVFYDHPIFYLHNGVCKTRYLNTSTCQKRRGIVFFFTIWLHYNYTKCNFCYCNTLRVLVTVTYHNYSFYVHFDSDYSIIYQANIHNVMLS